MYEKTHLGRNETRVYILLAQSLFFHFGSIKVNYIEKL